MDAGEAFQIIALLAAGGAGYAYIFNVGQKREEKKSRVGYYRRLVTDLRNAEQHFTEHRARLAELLEMEEMQARSTLEDAKFASRGMISYDPSDLHYVTDTEAERIRKLTIELKATDQVIADCQQAAMAGSNELPALHADLMRRVETIASESEALTRRLKPKANDYYWSD